MARGIYLIRNTTTGDCYVGQAQNIAKRWESHRAMLARGMHHSSRLQQDWDEYGADAFAWEVLEEVPIRTSLTNAEARHINERQPVYNSASVPEKPDLPPMDWRKEYTRTPDQCSAVVTVKERARCRGCGLAINIETRMRSGINRVEVTQPDPDTGIWEDIATAHFIDGDVIELERKLAELAEKVAEQERYAILLKQRVLDLEALLSIAESHARR